ncbi:ATPase RavA [Planctomycetes bacterium Pan216]|uniref:ATPase RavA n=1 Tax=Kolteria novifilia TaxID=2527975 RepID=A0A518B3N6_9BACT|nr:ATPase RavA [Planctomycetes bacterium Pan216]
MATTGQHTEALGRVRDELARVLVGQRSFVDRLLVGLLTGGHVLIEGVPGLAKTLAARTLASTIDARFQRVQFTPDLLPADLIGTEVYHPKTGEFSIREGPIFTQLLLADEINRAPAKVQSALLEAMQERQVTIGPETRSLPKPFFVMATQNPIEHEGTYPLPEAQVDRFLLKILVDYPDRADERIILDRMASTAPETNVDAVMSPETIFELRRAVDEVHLDEKIREYVLDIIATTRPGNPRAENESSLDLGPWLELGASPRASVALVLAAKAWALLDGRDYVVPHDVKEIAPDVLRHRLLLSFEAEAEEMTVDRLLQRLLEDLPVP